MQRLFDILFSLLALLILSPLLIPVIILLRLTGEGEIFFMQKRIGIRGQTFGLYKFATMLKNSPDIATGTVTIKNDPRILPLGKFLRKTKINELPQLLNILFGDMSVIGPRPLTQQTFGSYSIETQNIVKQVHPGLSGVGSIIFRGEEDILEGDIDAVEFYDTVIAPYKGALEEWYVKHQSMQLYFVAILVSLIAVFFPKSKIAWKAFKGLPKPPDKLKDVLNYEVK